MVEKTRHEETGSTFAVSLTALAYLLVFFSGAFWAVAGRPLIGLLLYSMSFYFYAPGSWWGNDLPDLRWALLSSVITLIAIWVRDSKQQTFSDAERVQRPSFFSLTEHKLFLMFVIWVWVQNIWAISPASHSEYAVMALKFLLLLYLIHRTLVDEKSILVFMLANLFGCAYFGWIGWSEHTAGRFESVPTPGLNDGNLLSLHMVPFLLLGAFLLLCNWSRKKYWLIIPVAFTLNAIFLTQSRGAIVGLVLGGLLALIFRPYRLRKIIYVYMILASLAAVRLVPEELVERLSQATAEKGEQDRSAESRLVIIRAQFDMFLSSPVSGYGHRGTVVLSPNYIDETYLTSADGQRVRASHNLLMSLLVDFGLVGTILYLSIILVFFKRLFSLRKGILELRWGNLSLFYLGSSCALAGLLVASMFSNSLRLEIDILLFGVLTAVYVQISAQSRNAYENPTQRTRVVN